MTNNPLLVDAPAIERARRFGSAQSIEGASCLEGTQRPPSRPIAAMTAIVCVAMTSIWGFVFIDPDMPGLDPTINYAWFVPTGPLFSTIWLTLTLCIAASFYLVLRSPPGNSARSLAIIAFIAQFILKSFWAWLLFGRRAPITGLYVMTLFVICVIASIWLAAKVDRRAALLMAPYVSWVAFILSLTISSAVVVGRAS
ncbi:TspO and MBR related proteins [Rhizobiales bacterium GAS113]|nr:TspO and MBR related proteins [Rhizobiales bacterium GAS113]